jgi:transposase
MRDKGFTVIEIADSLEITPRTVINICTTYEAHGIERALKDDPRPGRPREFDTRARVQIVATVCSEPPEGFDRWTLDLLKERLETEGIVSSIGRETIRAVLQEHDLKPWQQKMWCVPELDDEFIERMEDVLDVYKRPYNPVTC